MKDPRVTKVAEVLVDHCVALAENELVSISGSIAAEPLMLELYRACLERGAHPLLRPFLPAAQPLLYRFAHDHQLEFVWEPERWFIENLDVEFRILSDVNTRQLSQVDPSRQRIAARARHPLSARRMERGATGDLRWNVTLHPTEAIAMEAEMSLEEYEDLYYGACLVDTPDPVAAWKEVRERHQRLLDWMSGRSKMHIEADGTDLHLDITGRTFVSADGDSNFPDGEVFTGPVEDATTGTVAFSYRAIFGGQAVEGVRLAFAEGRVVEATAEKNERFLLETLDTDAGARVLGEVGIGTNYGISRFTGELLLDEKIGGTIHLALGASYPETGGRNQSAVHWDMVCDLRTGGRITVDGDTLLENGNLLV